MEAQADQVPVSIVCWMGVGDLEVGDVARTVRVTLRNPLVSSPTSPASMESVPFGLTMMTRMGSLNRGPETIWPSSRLVAVTNSPP